MCHFLNTFYTCTPEPRPARVPNHSLRTSLLCSNPNPCPLPLWETRTKIYPFPCPNCTGENTPFAPPTTDTWSAHHADTHDEAVSRYLSHLTHLLNTLLLSALPTSTASDFLAAYPTLRSETLCRQHGDHPDTCACLPTGPRAWLYNMSTTLRATTSSHALQAFLSNPVVSASIAGHLRDEVITTVKTLAERCHTQDFDEEVSMLALCEPSEAHIHSSIDPTRPLSEGTTFSEAESGRRMDYAFSAQDFVMARMTDALSAMPWHAGKTAEVGMPLRLQIARTFSLFVAMDPGLSPLRADMVSERLATLIADPFLIDCPIDFTSTRRLITALVPPFSPPGAETPPNPFTALYDELTRSVEEGRAKHTHELCFAMHAHLAFQHAVWPLEVDTFNGKVMDSFHKEYLPSYADKKKKMRTARLAKVAKGISKPAAIPAAQLTCTLADEGRCNRPVEAENQPPADADPQDWHVPRIRVNQCKHVFGRRCGFLAGLEAAEGTPHAWTCPACPEAREEAKAEWMRKKAKIEKKIAQEERRGVRRVLKRKEREERKKYTGWRQLENGLRHGGPERVVGDTILFTFPMTAAMNEELEVAVLGQLQGEAYPGTVRRDRTTKKAKAAKQRAKAAAEVRIPDDAEDEVQADAEDEVLYDIEDEVLDDAEAEAQIQAEAQARA